MRAEDDEDRKVTERKKSVSVDDLNDALMEETTDDSEAEGAASNAKEEDEACSSSAGLLNFLLDYILRNNRPQY